MPNHFSNAKRRPSVTIDEPQPTSTAASTDASASLETVPASPTTTTAPPLPYPTELMPGLLDYITKLAWEMKAELEASRAERALALASFLDSNDNNNDDDDDAHSIASSSSSSTSGHESNFITKKNRCLGCKKRVGLTGFTCRCGGLYCSLHRYSDKHECNFDYKKLAEEEIRRNNPVVIASKIQKI